VFNGGGRLVAACNGDENGANNTSVPLRRRTMTVTETAEVDITQIRAELHRLIDRLPEREAFDALDHMRWLLSDEDELTEEEWEAVREGEAEIARGEYVTLEEIGRQTTS